MFIVVCLSLVVTQKKNPHMLECFSVMTHVTLNWGQRFSFQMEQ